MNTPTNHTEAIDAPILLDWKQLIQNEGQIPSPTVGIYSNQQPVGDMDLSVKGLAHLFANIESNLVSAPDADGVTICRECLQMKSCLETGGNLKEFIWYACLGVARFFKEPLAHELSSGYPNYTYEETERKLAQLQEKNILPTTCKRFEQINPAGCEGCTYRGLINSPIRLGYSGLQRIAPQGVGEMTTAERVVVEISGDQFHLNVAQCHQALARGFRDAMGEYIAIDAKGCMHTIKKHAIRVALSESCWFIVYDKRENKRKAIAPPQDIADAVMDTARTNGIAPIIHVVLRNPGIDPVTGALMGLKRGYIPEHQAYCLHDWNRDPAMLDRPDLNAVAKALQTLWQPVHRFPFESPEHRATMLCAMLSAVIRPVLPQCPGFLIDSPSFGSGKTKLATILAILTGQHEPAVIPWRNNDEAEAQKKLLSLLLMGAGAVMIDNVNGLFHSDALAAILTSTSYSDRKLGVSMMATTSTRILIVFNGCNASVSADLVRRILTISIDPGIERPELRDFDFDPAEMVRQNTDDYVEAVLVILRAYICAGSSTYTSPLGSFEIWDRLVRQCVLWLDKQGLGEHFGGLADPLVTMETARENDPDKARLSALLQAWQECFGSKGSTVQNAIKTVTDFPSTPENVELKLMLEEIAGERGTINPRMLAAWIGRRQGRIVDGFHFVKIDTKKEKPVWAAIPQTKPVG
jgi:hypothetical protein